MTIEAVLRLIIALARVLKVNVHTLAQAYEDAGACQDYYDKLVAIADEYERQPWL